MLFNSYTFLFLFLPVALAGAFVLARYRTSFAVAWLVFASLFFYGWWSWRHVPLLVASIAFNYIAGAAIVRRGGKAGGKAFGILAGAVAANLAVLGYFKYAGFLVANVDAFLGTGMRVEAIVLPLGISFFTFTQIAYLVDVYRDPVRYGVVPYALFVSYFPHLIAGPILHHREMMPQFAAPTSYRFDYSNLAAGLTIFAIGLFKKTVLADGIAPYASPVYAQAAQGYAPGMVEAWGAAVAFGLQLYFDFSAYSDMAVGLSKMLGIRMPVNFESPYKATSIVEFWRRWHMTLSRFLRDYVYVALGGNRRGTARRYANLLVTMLLGGLWHGAAWTFVLWGALHGAFLAINHGWIALRRRLPPGPIWVNRIGTACRRRADVCRGLRRMDDLSHRRLSLGASHRSRVGRPERPRAAARPRSRRSPRPRARSGRHVSFRRPSGIGSWRTSVRWTPAFRPAWRAAGAPACSSARRSWHGWPRCSPSPGSRPTRGRSWRARRRSSPTIRCPTAPRSSRGASTRAGPSRARCCSRRRSPA